MDSTLAYEIGAVFLFAAMVMFGTWTGLTKKLFGLFGTKSIIALLAAGLCFVFYQYSSQILAALPLGSSESSRESAVPASARAVPASPAVSTTSAASAMRSSRTAASSAKPVEHWKTVVVEESTPAPQVAPPPAPIQETPAAVEPAKVDPCDKSQYQGKLKRWMKSAGCAIHVVPRK